MSTAITNKKFPYMDKLQAKKYMLDKKIYLIAACDDDGAIGKNGIIPWKCSEDMRYFKHLTTNHSVIMGRKTYESIGKPLPNRENIVITRSTDLSIDGCKMANSLEDAIFSANSNNNIFIIGGGNIYSQALEYATMIFLTKIPGSYNGDTFFPELNKNSWSLVSEVNHCKESSNDIACTFFIYERD